MDPQNLLDFLRGLPPYLGIHRDSVSEQHNQIIVRKVSLFSDDSLLPHAVAVPLLYSIDSGYSGFSRRPATGSPALAPALC